MYDTDFVQWCAEQAEALRSGSAIDRLNLAEEIEAVGRQEYVELRARVENVMRELGEWKRRPEDRDKHLSVINEEAAWIHRTLVNSPSLSGEVDQSILAEFAEADALDKDTDVKSTHATRDNPFIGNLEASGTNDESQTKIHDFDRLRAKQRLEMLLYGTDNTLLSAVLGAALQYGAFASFLDDETKGRLLAEAGDYNDFFLYKAIQYAIRVSGEVERASREQQ